MKRAWSYIISVLTTVMIFASCVKPFNPAVSTVNANILVVEGFVNTGGDTTKITLSHTVTINSKNSSVAETGATVTVENAAGASYAVPETTTKGSYASKGALTLITGTQYRLRIKTAGGKTYLSSLVDSKLAPPIDSIGYLTNNRQMQLYVNAHDDAGKTIYYKYNFSEAWVFHARYLSDYIFKGKMIGKISPAQSVFFCYGQDSSTNIGLNTTSALSKDVAYHFIINTMSDTSEKLVFRYSILVSQQALTKDGYAFWQNLKKNTEQLGSIFDAQPSAISGNIYNIANPAEPVIGFISAGTVQKKRIYINKTDLPASYVAGYPYTCSIQDASTDQHSIDPPFVGSLFTYQKVYRVLSIQDTINPITTFTYTPTVCADCTVRGTVKPPAFWKP